MSIFEIIISVALFMLGYILNMFYTSVLYHRGLAHKALDISNGMRRFIFASGMWVTGIDPKGWVCMHRMHHSHSDTEEDPHTPEQCGSLWSMFRMQYLSYNKVLKGLMNEETYYTKVVKDMEEDVHWLVRKRYWIAPHIVHVVIGIVLAFVIHPVAGIAYILGILSHPVQGALVNYYGHKSGYRNFETNDKSTNNWIVAFLCMGEGFQNNHHHRPGSAKFKVKWWEVDFGYALCRVGKFIGIIRGIKA